MKGWHRESMRHSLAARGLSCRGHLYHGTQEDFIENIKREGLDPDHCDIGERPVGYGDPFECEEPLSKYIYLADKEMEARVFGKVMLRVNTEDLEQAGILEFDEDRDAWRFDSVIPPEFIEIQDKDGKWIKLME